MDTDPTTTAEPTATATTTDPTTTEPTATATPKTVTVERLIRVRGGGLRIARYVVPIAVALLAPLLAVAQDVGEVAGAVASVWPGAAKYIALVPIVQLVAKLLAPLPGRIGGFTHATIWSRFWDTVAAFPAAPAPRVSAELKSGEGAP